MKVGENLVSLSFYSIILVLIVSHVKLVIGRF